MISPHLHRFLIRTNFVANRTQSLGDLNVEQKFDERPYTTIPEQHLKIKQEFSTENNNPIQNKSKESSSFQQIATEQKDLSSNHDNLNIVGSEHFNIMQMNLRKQRHRSQTPQYRYPCVSFNGPFFRLEEVGQRLRSASSNPLMPVNEADEIEYSQAKVLNERGDQRDLNPIRIGDSDERSKPISASESNLKDPSFSNYCKNDERLKVVIWPPPPPPTSSLLSGNNVCIRRKNIMDPERINEYKRQKEIEMEAIRRKERETMRLLQKQMQTSQIYRKERSGDKVESPFRNDNLLVKDAQFYGSNSDYRTINTSNIKNEPNPQVRVFETRPISAFSEDLSSQELMYSPSSQTWKRTYVVDTQSPIAKNEIISSRELLERERFDVDLLKLREAFIVKPELELEIHRTGRKWKPPPDPPYIWSTSRLSYNTDLEMLSSNTPIPVSSELSESEEYRWEPYKTDSNYKYERKDFVPDDVSNRFFIKGSGPGSLDDVAKRQVKYLIPPSPDGTHRPKALFRGPRSTPSGGFCPRAPNSIKVVKKKDSRGKTISVETYEPRDEGDQYFIPGSGGLSTYDLPPHTSTLTDRVSPRRVDVRRQCDTFEKSIKSSKPMSAKRTDSAENVHIPSGNRRCVNTINRITVQSPNLEKRPKSPKKRSLMRIIKITPTNTKPSSSSRVRVNVSRSSTPYSSIQKLQNTADTNGYRIIGQR